AYATTAITAYRVRFIETNFPGFSTIAYTQAEAVILEGVPMKKFIVSVCLTAGFGLFAADQSSLGLAPPDAGFVIGIEWRRLMDTGISSTLSEQLKKSDFTKLPGVPAAVESLVRDLDSVLIAGPASGLNGKSGNQPPILMVVKGRFDVGQIRGFLTG